MTPVRGKRGRLVHLMATGASAPNLLCPTRIKAPIVEPDAPITCERCLEAATFN